MALEQILSNLEFSVDPFALCDIRGGWRLNLEPPGAVVVHFVLAGRGTFRFRGGPSFEVHPGHLIVVPRTVAHSVEAGQSDDDVTADASQLPSGQVTPLSIGTGAPGAIMACGRVAATYGGVTGLFDRFDTPVIVDFSDRPQVRALFDMLLEEQSQPGAGSVALASALMQQCFILVLRRLARQGDDRIAWIAGANDPQLARVVDAIIEDPARSHTVESLAKQAAMSRSAFTEKFRAAFGTSPIEFVRDVRMRRAAALLRHTDHPVKAIARMVGLASRSHFSHTFVDRFGVSPSDFRSAIDPDRAAANASA
jgi:AraC-like DNA-binding protein